MSTRLHDLAGDLERVLADRFVRAREHVLLLRLHSHGQIRSASRR
jgi:hypothetical protein